jgi:DNA-binding IclR family transcriptional regulator
MPIDIAAFKRASEHPARDRRPGVTHGDTVLAFLVERPAFAFTPAEIVAATGVPRGSVRVALSRPEDRGLVRHRGRHWAVTAAPVR